GAQAACARHVLDHNRRITRDVLAEVTSKHAPMGIVAAADAVADHDGHGAAAIEALNGLGMGGAWEAYGQGYEEGRIGMAPLLPLPACHQGVYARLRRAMERVGVRGPLNRLRLAEAPPHPARKSAPTSPRKRGEVKAAATAT